MQIIYKPATGPAVAIDAIFNDPYLRVEFDVPAGIETSVPSVFVRLSSLPVDPHIDEPLLTIDGVTYRVTERKPAGLGSIRLMLRQV